VRAVGDLSRVRGALSDFLLICPLFYLRFPASV
jgi:hypothetical protein